VETISCKLRLPFVAVELTAPDGSTVTVEHGRRIAEPVAFHMMYQGREEGRLLAGPRCSGKPFDAVDRRLLTMLADQIAPVAHSVQLTTALRQSRERAVRGREEERRRLRRDLHDGLGPILSGLRLGIDGVARRLTPTSPEGDALVWLAAQAAAGGAEVRRLINDLRPDALDSLGLVGAIEETADRFAANYLDQPSTKFEIRAQQLPANLPAAVEVATHWIVTEAMHNVLRHANASRCVVTLRCDNTVLEVVVDDDGKGLCPSPVCPAIGAPPSSGGVGMISMRERAEEIGGRCSIADSPLGGVRVLARLPVGTP
jgi:signal transduction histidine kinase